MTKLNLVTYKMNFKLKAFEKVTTTVLKFDSQSEANDYLINLDYIAIENETNLFNKHVVTKHGVYNLQASKAA